MMCEISKSFTRHRKRETERDRALLSDHTEERNANKNNLQGFLHMQNLSLKYSQYTHTRTQRLAQLLCTCERVCSRNRCEAFAHSRMDPAAVVAIAS